MTRVEERFLAFIYASGNDRANYMGAGGKWQDIGDISDDEFQNLIDKFTQKGIIIERDSIYYLATPDEIVKWRNSQSD